MHVCSPCELVIETFASKFTFQMVPLYYWNSLENIISEASRENVPNLRLTEKHVIALLSWVWLIR